VIVGDRFVQPAQPRQGCPTLEQGLGVVGPDGKRLVELGQGLGVFAPLAQGGCIVGMGVRALRRAFQGLEPERLGVVPGLRLSPCEARDANDQGQARGHGREPDPPWNRPSQASPPASGTTQKIDAKYV